MAFSYGGLRGSKMLPDEYWLTEQRPFSNEFIQRLPNENEHQTRGFGYSSSSVLNSNSGIQAGVIFPHQHPWHAPLPYSPPYPPSYLPPLTSLNASWKRKRDDLHSQDNSSASRYLDKIPAGSNGSILPGFVSPISVSHHAPQEPARRKRTKRNPQTMAIEERKTALIDNPTDAMRHKTTYAFNKVFKLLNESRKEDDCWLHPSPPRPRNGGRGRGVISICFDWGKSPYRHMLYVNFGILALLQGPGLTDDQKQGFINHAWQLSHVCGNWTCCNPKHHTVEPLLDNISRNFCFGSSAPCTHSPVCLKEKKVALAASGQPIAMENEVPQIEAPDFST